MAEVSKETLEQVMINLGGVMKKLNKVWNDDNYKIVEDMLLDIAVSIKLLSDKGEWLHNLSVEAQNIYSRAEEELEQQGYYN